MIFIRDQWRCWHRSSRTWELAPVWRHAHWLGLITSPSQGERTEENNLNNLQQGKLNYLFHFHTKLLSGKLTDWLGPGTAVPGWFVWLFFYKWYSPCIIELKLGFISQVIVSYIYHNQNNNSPLPEPRDCEYFSSLHMQSIVTIGPMACARLASFRHNKTERDRERNRDTEQLAELIMNERDQSVIITMVMLTWKKNYNLI